MAGDPGLGSTKPEWYVDSNDRVVWGGHIDISVTLREGDVLSGKRNTIYTCVSLQAESIISDQFNDMQQILTALIELDTLINSISNFKDSLTSITLLSHTGETFYINPDAIAYVSVSSCGVFALQAHQLTQEVMEKKGYEFSDLAVNSLKSACYDYLETGYYN